ncbi:MAG: hypothetical protein ACTHU0_28275 [Kofleriaceae bacterium]
MLALRIARRRTAWESSPLDEIIKTEFSMKGELELNMSVYLIDANDLVRAVAEHSAGFDVGPRGFPNLDLNTDRALVETPGTTGFEFTTNRHRELRFEDEADLRKFLSETILPHCRERTHIATRTQVKDYARSRNAVRDPEWERHTTWP